MTQYEVIRQRHVEHAMGRLPQHLERVKWSAERLRTERTARLRTLLTIASTRSPWHRARLSGVDVDRFDEDRLRELPVMTKSDLMAHFDDIVTDQRVTLDLVNKHVGGLTTDAYLFDEYHAFASGGSSGVRGVFVWGWEAWADCYLILMRLFLTELQREPATEPRELATMVVAAEGAAHMTSSMGQTFGSSAFPVHRFPVTLPLETIVGGLNRVNGGVLITYPSMLAMLAAEARRGRLTISPRRIITTAEPLLPEIRDAALDAWGAAISNSWAASEGGELALGCFQDTGMHLSDDFVILEPVDENGATVPAGSQSAKVYLTNLFNPLLPIIRYEITDQVTLLDSPCSCGSQHRRIADIQGRLDDVFRYADGVVVHPHIFRSVLGRDARIIEYQVRQTERGAAVLLRTREPTELKGLERALEEELARAGRSHPLITASIVDHISRVGIGKLKRFVPLEQSTG
jgi:phenylacetate-coenzyme A ligase PaaK-like adenylate-forming protein